MADIEGGLILDPLRKIQDRLSCLEHDQRGILAELQSRKSLPGTVIHRDAVRDGRIAELTLRLERIEERLELKD